jgi:hypothetical protein
MSERRVTTAPVEVTDWKGTYTLEQGSAFRLAEVQGDVEEGYVDIEVGGILSSSMGGVMSRFDFDTKTRQADL